MRDVASSHGKLVKILMRKHCTSITGEIVKGFRTNRLWKRLVFESLKLQRVRSFMS